MSASFENKIHEVNEWLGTGSLNFFGKPFGGKDTQSEKLAPFFNAPILGGGQILRNSVIPPETQTKMNRGELIPTEDFVKIVMPYLSNPDFADGPLFLSSVGRVSGEEQGVINATEAAGHSIKAVPYFDITNDEVFRRLANTPDRGRADDTPASMEVRLEEFYTKTQPVLDTYEKMGLLLPVDAMTESDVVFNSMVHLLHDRALES